MDPSRWRQIEQLYHAALERKPGERAAFLEQSCAADPGLRHEVESLLAISDDADGYLKAAIREATPQPSEANAASSSRPDATPIPRKLGRYELLEQVGRGGMGVVYRAVDPAIGRIVAIKTIPLDDAAGEQSSELRVRLLRESQAGGQLSHPNIVAVHDVSEQGNTAYIVMEFVVGRTLDQALANDSSPRATAEALRIVQECATALDYAHSRGVVHRDIKPANIMLQTDGAVKIADFGIAKASQFTALTRSSVLVGSPHYMAPEQWRGEAVTGQVDQYALASVAYAMLTGRRPFENDTMASLAAKTMYEEPPAATTLNRALHTAVDNVFRKALAKTPAARYQTCTQFAGALRGACEATAILSPPPSVPARRKTNWLAAVIIVVVLAALAGGALLYQRNSAAQYEITYWTSVKDSKSRATFDDYLRRYPQGQFADLAKSRLEELKSAQPPATKPVTSPTEIKIPAKVNPTKTPEKAHRDPVPPRVSPPPKPEPIPAGDLYVQADALSKHGAYAEAVPLFTRAIQNKPDYRTYFGRAGAYQHLEQLPQAIADYSEAIKLNPDSFMPYHERAVCEARLKDDDRAFDDYNKALSLAPGYAFSLNGRGVIYLHRKQYQKAVPDFNDAIRLNPKWVQPFQNRAAARKALGDLAGANADLAEAKRLSQ
jgi:tetratricopeptide (TPR) repeat protein